MASYDYKNGKSRIEEILNNETEIKEKEKVPKDDNFTFSNGYYSWVSAIFVDIRESSKLFTDDDKEKVAKIIRSFTSEIIEILKKDDNLREIGIRGDCVYAIYTTPSQEDIYKIAEKTFFINTFMKMLNKLLEKKYYPTIKVGIGMSTAKELVVKAGRKNASINNKVWIGDAVTKASNLSSLGNKDGVSPIVFSELSYTKFIEQLVENNKNKNPKSWFEEESTYEYGIYYSADIIEENFYNWIKNGMN
ncbi:adenylate cyclase [Fusobacterium hwasookii ChDC F174]|uniref:Adenylate cyclase n=1 Tax=Fusobacterium hwasookii ChDC F174 TaxID=1307442 RepID=A0A0S2ZLR4_9FUSO|nr:MULTISPECIES: adenylate/guanylate cyclase domain-containing protein [Fusobacterium]ALQ39721.1 adenylate cyclase [Fusobacterium hwasookii ChDC F174]MCG6838531.1 adenylate/guanylate cyclase domain-containing protein [Fusobacterium nucleatum]